MVSVLLSHGADANTSDTYGDSPLIIAIREKRKEIAQKLLSCGADVHLVRRGGETALHFAARVGWDDVVCQLIENGAEVNRKDLDQWTPLMISCLNGFPDTADLLIKHGADVNTENCEGFSPLRMAAFNGHEVVVDVLIKARCNVNHAAKDGNTPLSFASCENNIQIFKKLLNNGADVNHCNKQGQTPLCLACMSESEDVVSYLLSPDVKVGINISDNFNNTPLMYSCLTGNFNITKRLLESGADTLMVNNGGCTALQFAVNGGHATLVQQLLESDKQYFCRSFSQQQSKEFQLHIACMRNDLEIVRALIRGGCDVERRDAEGGRPPLMLCAALGNIDTIGELLKAGAKVNVSDREGYTPLMVAVNLGAIKPIEDLLCAGADVNMSNNTGRTALMIASKHDDGRIVDLLLSNGANINAQNSWGWTTLMMISRHGHIKPAKILLENGADLAVSKDGETALSISSYFNHHDLAELLVQAEITFNNQVREGWTPLHHVAKQGLTNIAKHLIEKKVSVDECDSQGVTPLMLACEQGHVDLLRLLIEKEADVNAASSIGQTPVHKAVAGGHYDVLTMLASRSARLNCSDNEGKTPLTMAAVRGSVKLLSSLLQNDLDIDQHDGCGWTALMLCSKFGYEECIAELVARGASLHLSNPGEATALHICAGKGYSMAAKILLDKGSEVNAQDNEGMTALMNASKNNHFETVRCLLKSNNKPLLFCQDYAHGNTALHIAAEIGNKEIVSLLLDEGAEINATNEIGRTPLHTSAVHGHKDIIKKLLANGADTDVADSGGNTALMLSTQNKQYDVAKYLLPKDDVEKSDHLEKDCVGAEEDYLENSESLERSGVHCHSDVVVAGGSGQQSRDMVVASGGQQNRIMMVPSDGQQNNDIMATTGGDQQNRDMVKASGTGQQSRDKVVTSGGQQNSDMMVACGGQQNRDIVATTGGGQQNKDMVQASDECQQSRDMVPASDDAQQSRDIVQASGDAQQSRDIVQASGDGQQTRDMVAGGGDDQHIRQPMSVETLFTISESKDLVEGDLEFEVFGEGDLEDEASLAIKKCDKYPGHSDFIPLPEFTIKHLPERFQNEEILDCIKALGDLTVRISVKISSDRPKDDQFSKFAGKRLAGSGYVVSVHLLDKGCFCNLCETDGYKDRKWWQINLQSATHCVTDTSEAESTRVDFFYDSEKSLTDRKVVSLNGTKMYAAEVTKDVCILTCATHDHHLGKYLQQRCEQRQFREESKPLVNILSQKPVGSSEASNNNKVIVCISHPHGSSKQVTVGELRRRRELKHKSPEHVAKSLVLKGMTGLSDMLSDYTTPTCRGSSGSVTICLDDFSDKDNYTTEWISPEGTHLRGNRSTGLNTGLSRKVLLKNRLPEKISQNRYFENDDDWIKWLHEVKGAPTWIK